MPAKSSAQPREQAAPLRIVPGGGSDKTITVSLNDILSRAEKLVEQPGEMARLMALTNDPGTQVVAQLEDIVLADQALASQVLALANSSYFAPPHTALYAREALVYLGFKMMRSLALAVSTQQLFDNAPRQLWLKRKSLWRHSLEVALTSRKIAEHLYTSGQADIASEETFTAGLLHDIGKLALDAWDSDRALMVSRLMEERDLRYSEIEATLFPHGHCQVGAALASRWGLPEAIIDAIACHHAPKNAVDAPELAAVVALANELARCGGHAVVCSPPIESALAQLSLTVSALPELAAACVLEAKNIRALRNLL